ncbi:hypothetical protein [Streptosporangium subroseum]|uniref:hypothetical protein n=1 Tax=Streptosporangium subroseum TaxID=106412 RepID=UPI0030907F8D|nr:hypothetical protein OHB15_27080 [Streptosporangium subroseum]
MPAEAPVLHGAGEGDPGGSAPDALVLGRGAGVAVLQVDSLEVHIAFGANSTNPIVYLSSPEKFTLPQALTQFVDACGGPMWNVQLAAASMTALPVLVVFVLAQRQFIEGLAHTGLKG